MVSGSAELRDLELSSRRALERFTDIDGGDADDHAAPPLGAGRTDASDDDLLGSVDHLVERELSLALGSLACS